MSKLAIFISALALSISVETTTADEVSGLRGDPAAIADAVAMVEAMERAPYSIYRLAQAIARGDSHLEVGFGTVRTAC